MLKVNIFELAIMQLKRENKKDFTNKDLIVKAVTIRKWFDKHKNQAERIMAGDTVYFYGNKIKTYNRSI